jgi:sugar phosphate isomerase/epimerase
MPQLSFITANYVARALEYNGETDWSAHDVATVRSIDGQSFGAICNDIAAAGFDCIDIWTAHCHHDFHRDSDYLEVVKGLCSAYDFTIASYAGGLRPSTAAEIESPFRFMKQLGAPLFAGGIFGSMPADEAMPHIQAACEKYNVRYAFENHPETSIAEIRAKMGTGKFNRCGVALDTGWCARQGIDALEAARQLREHLLIVHLKDIQPGGIETCALGEGIVPVEKVVRYLIEDGWDGPISIEHSTYDHDPMPEIERSLGRARQWVSK